VLRASFRRRFDRAGIGPVSTRYGPDELLEFRILGPLEVTDGRGREVGLGGAKQRATLAILLLNANRVVSVDRLADELYAGAAPVTALKQVQRQISELRKALGSVSVIETRSPGYIMGLSPDQIDLSVFETLSANATEALSAGDARRAAELLRQALGLWRGAPLADLTYESFARASIERLEEMRLAVVELRIDADLALGRHTELVPELEQLAAEHLVRERLHAQLMLALYRSGRQAEALAAYSRAREALMEGFGIEPGRELRRLQREVLAQEPSLDLVPDRSRPGPSSADPPRTVLAAPADESGTARLVALAGPLARLPQHELIVAELVASERELARAVGSLEAARSRVEGTIRVAGFTSAEPATDIVRLAGAYDVALVLVEAPPNVAAAPLPAEIVTVLDGSPADVGIVAGASVDWGLGSGIFVPFGGSEHDWAALELAAWLGSAVDAPLRLVGADADPTHGRRDASRLLANASVAVQRLAGVSAEPLLFDPTGALLEAVDAATLVIAGLSARWRTEGVGTVRRSLLRTHRPVVLSHGGPRPSGLAPRDAHTRFSWSVAR
jgi:DNA-binding SARP family transcriptional activator